MVLTSWNESSASTKVKMRLFFLFCVMNYVGGTDLCRFPEFFCENYTFFSRKIGARFTFLMISAKLLCQVRRT